MKQVSLSIALAICAFASAQNFYAREWTPNSSFDVLELDVNNDGVADFTSGSNDINTLHTNAFLGTYVANPSKIKYLRFNESVGPNNTELSWVGEGIGNYRYDENALSISETQNRTYPLTGENYYYVAYNNNHNVVYPFKVGNRYGFFIFTKNTGGSYSIRYSVISTVDATTITVDPSTWNTTLGIDQNKSPECITIQQNDQQLELSTTTPMKSLELLDLTGKRIAMQLHSTQIPTSGLKQGVYLLRVIDEKNRIYTQKVLLHSTTL